MRGKSNRCARELLAGLAVLACLLTAPTANAADYHLILSGSGGEAEFSDRFRDWSTKLREALVASAEVPAERIMYLAEPETENAPKDRTINLESITSIFTYLTETLTEDDTLFIYMIGHGSYLNRESRFLIPGPDLTAVEMAKLLEPIKLRRAVVINGTSSSAGFVNELSGENRIICTATKSATERNATRFMNFFVEALEDGSADRNRDERISVLEACRQAAELTSAWYETEGLISTEHPILDDNADGLGSRLPIPDAAFSESADDPSLQPFDGSLARVTYIKDYSFPENAPQKLIDTYLALLDDITELRGSKKVLDESEYYAKLERLLVDAALANREIRAYAPIPRDDS